MKKFVFVIIAGLVLSACCEVCDETTSNKQIVENPVDVILDSEEYYYSLDATHFEYNGHKYILFEEYERWGGIVHDPDCPCHKKDNNDNSSAISDYPDWW